MDEVQPDEPEDAEHEEVPADLLELHQVLEWEKATALGLESLAQEGYGTNE